MQTRHAGDGAYEAQIDLGSGGKFPWDFRIEMAQDQTILAVAQWQVTPETKGVKFVSGESGASGEGEIDYYTCTMHPSVKDKQPGKCPICAMNLMPVLKKGAVQQTGAADKQVRTVNISLYQQQLIGVQRDTVKLRPVSQTIRTIGHVAYDETRIATVNLKFSGWVEKLYVACTGQLVKQRQPLFDIYSPELVSTQEEYLQTLRYPSNKLRSNGSKNRTGDGAGNRENSLLKSSRDRLLLWGISEEQIAELEKTRTPNLELTVYSPISGYVLEKNTLQGRHAKAGTDLYTIADLSTIWVHADIYEYELPFIEVGQKATIKMAYAPGAEYIFKTVSIPPGYTLAWAGQYKYLQRLQEKLALVVPVTLFIIFMLLYFNFKSIPKTLIVMLSVPFSLVGAFWLLWLLGYNTSVAVWIGIIALAGVAAETGVVMIVYLDEFYDRCKAEGRMQSRADLYDAIIKGAVQRVRPKMMTVTAIMAGLLPIMWSTGTGADVMKRIAAPMVGMVTSTILTLCVIPAIYAVWRGRAANRRKGKATAFT